MQYLLDTNICIAIIKNRPEKVKARLEKVSFNEVGISSIALAELAYGVAHSQKRRKNQEALEDFLKYVEVLDWPAHAATEYGNIRALLEASGTAYWSNGYVDCGPCA